MVKPFPLILLVLGGIVVAKTLLTAYWSRLLHRRHGSRYSYSAIFWRLFRPGWEYSMLLRPGWADDDEDLWEDIEPIQGWDFLSNIILVGVVLAMVAINDAIREINQ